jgi:hypothetical protein
MLEANGPFRSCLWVNFHLPRMLLCFQGTILHNDHKINTHHKRCQKQMDHSSSHKMKCYACAPICSPIPCLSQSPFLGFSHKVNTHYRWGTKQTDPSGFHEMKSYACRPIFSSLSGSWLRKGSFLALKSFQTSTHMSHRFSCPLSLYCGLQRPRGHSK